jgi:prevent-host-death family protein
MQLNIHEAKTQFSKVVAAVENGETVTICRSGRPVISCVPAVPAGPFPFGAWGELPDEGASLDRMVGPTDEGTPGGMEL